MSSALDPYVPNWGRMAAAQVAGELVLQDNVLHLPTSLGSLRLSLHEFGLRLRSGGDVRDYGILCGDLEPLPLKLDFLGSGDQSQSRLHARTATGEELLVSIGHAPFSFALYRDGRCVQESPRDGHFVRRFRLPPLARHDDRWLLTLELGPSTPVYGLGEKSGRLDKRGQLLRSYNRDALGLNAEWSYKNVPYAWSPDGWGAFVHTPV
ncbi:MAG: alpha-xylosidase, partial [Gammaproteobacteria bacterium]|nr:alpha-xylosidase [Gammaproteobacteria bacterium]